MFIREGTPRGFRTMSSGRTVSQEWHIFLRQDSGNNTLITMTTCHLIADRNLTFLSDVAANNHVNTRS